MEIPKKENFVEPGESHIRKAINKKPLQNSIRLLDCLEPFL